MKWIEMIRIRSSLMAIEIFKKVLLERMKQLDELEDLESAYLLEHTEYDGDMAVVMQWKESRPPARSREGLLLTSVLEKYGSVDHSIWVIDSSYEKGAVCCVK
jgi:hypothetical protein